MCSLSGVVPYCELSRVWQLIVDCSGEVVYFKLDLDLMAFKNLADMPPRNVYDFSPVRIESCSLAACCAISSLRPKPTVPSAELITGGNA